MANKFFIPIGIAGHQASFNVMVARHYDDMIRRRFGGAERLNQIEKSRVSLGIVFLSNVAGYYDRIQNTPLSLQAFTQGLQGVAKQTLACRAISRRNQADPVALQRFAISLGN
jgi:hypothetical protein